MPKRHRNWDDSGLMNNQISLDLEIPIFSVSELNNGIKSKVEREFGAIRVVGEISNFKVAASGHAYFSLKDEHSVVSLAAFGWLKNIKFSQLRALISDGLEVICAGRVSVYSPRGTYQVLVDQIELRGHGGLQQKLENLKRELQQEGLFDYSAKLTLPKFPSQIALVTSPYGAAIEDIRNVLTRRGPFLKVDLFPVRVQGEGAAAEISTALKRIDRTGDYDVILLSRGGGSIEDLWEFNNVELARIIFELDTPIICGVGHEIDTTIADLVADVRAPTPSAAAEMLTNSWMIASNELESIKDKIVRLLHQRLRDHFHDLERIKLRLVDPRDRLYEMMQRIDDFDNRLELAIRASLSRSSAFLVSASDRLNALSPMRVLERGYTIVQNDDGVIRSVNEMSKGKQYQVRFYDGVKTVLSD